MPSLVSHALNAALRNLVKRRLHSGLSVDAVRSTSATLERWAGRGELSRSGEPVMAGSVPCEWFPPPVADEGRVVLLLHGGGFIAHLLSAYRVFARRLAGVLAGDYYPGT